VSDPRLEEFVRDSLPGLSRYAYALTGVRHVGDDLVQDTLLKVARAWRRIRSDGNPFGYAKTVMFRTYLNGWRVRRRSADVELTDYGGDSDAYSLVEARDMLRRTLARLPRDQRAVLVLGYLEDLPDDEIARLLDRKPATVRSLRHRGLATLRQQVGLEAAEDAHGQG